jgi:hypothetical protein
MGELPLERLRFFNGRLLTVDDFQLEQDYLRKKLQRHNRSLHGFGVVSGLKVDVNPKQIIIEAGLALDCEGNEVVIPEAQTVVLPPATEGWRSAFLSVRYVEESGASIPTPEGPQPATSKESFEIVVCRENHNRGHRHLRARWLVCGTPHPLTLGKLRNSGQGWRIDRRYRAPAVK